MIEFFIEYKQIIFALHMLGVAFGLGGATITDYTFFRAVKDKKLSEDEHHLLKGLSNIIWAGIVLLVLTGIALFVPQSASLLQSAKFIAKMCAVAVVIINGVLLTALITPRMRTFDYTFQEASPNAFHRLSFSLGAVSASSWYSAFILAFLPRVLPVHNWLLAAVYGGILLAAILGGQVMYMLSKKIHQSKI